MYMYEESKQYEEALLESERDLMIIDYELGLIRPSQTVEESIIPDDNILIPERIRGANCFQTLE